MKKILTLTSIFLLSACMGEVQRNQSTEIRTISEFDTESYLGAWYEIARYPNWFERDCIAAKAEYAPLSADEISVTNTCQLAGNPTEYKVSRGKAKIVDTAQLNVTFAPFYIGNAANYWILGLQDNKIAVIGNPAGTTGWILARDTSITEDEKSWALGILTENGYNTNTLQFVAPFEDVNSDG